MFSNKSDDFMFSNIENDRGYTEEVNHNPDHLQEADNLPKSPTYVNYITKRDKLQAVLINLSKLYEGLELADLVAANIDEAGNYTTRYNHGEFMDALVKFDEQLTTLIRAVRTDLNEREKVYQYDRAKELGF